MSGLRDFLNEYLNIRRMVREKRKFNQMQERAKALPEEYTYVYQKIQHYMWGNSWRYSAVGMDLMPLFADLLDLFETGAAEGKRVLEITGEDVAAFCDELLQSTYTHTQNWREDLNRDITNKLGKEKGRK